jgi:RNA polymerase sigma factor (sigma-70 family)
MPAGPLHSVLRQLRKLVGAAAEPTDVALLESFIERHDEGAFAVLLRAHGPMVLDVCRNVLGNEQDAEDAFQVTFLVLACKAAAVRKRHSLASWLFGTARRVSLKVRTQSARRRAHERQAPAMRPPQSEPETHELRPVLHEELGRLPEKYQAPLILCYLQGKSNAEAAQELGCPKGTVQGRLARARALLQKRLKRRGISLSAVLPAALVTSAVVRAEVPGQLVETTLKHALLAAGGTSALLQGLPATTASLVERVLHDMFLNKLRRVAVVLLVLSVLGLGAGLATRAALASREGEQVKASAAPTPEKAEPPSIRRDSLGDALPAGAVARLGTLRLLHQGPVYALAFSPDKKTLASQGGDDLIRIWELSSGREIRQLRLPPPPKRDADDKLVPAGRSAEPPLPPGYPIAFAPDGKLLAAGTKTSSIALWETATGQKLPDITGHQGQVTCLAFTPAGQLLSGSADKTIRLWDVAARKEVRQFAGHDGPVLALALAADKQWLVSASSDQTARLWDLDTARPIRKFAGHASAVRTVALSPDNKTLVSGDAGWVPRQTEDVSAKATIRFWDTDTAAEIGRFDGLVGGVCSLAFAPDGKTLAAGIGDMTSRLWEFPSKRELARLGGFKGRAFVTHFPIYSVAFSPDGQTLASGSIDRRVRLLDVKTHKERFGYAAQQEPIAQLVLSADSRLVAALTDRLRHPAPDSNRVRLWDLAERKITAEITSNKATLTAIDFGRDGKNLVSASGYGPLQVWDAATGQELRSFGGDKLRAAGIAVSPRDSLVAAGISDDRDTAHAVRLFDGKTGQELGRLPLTRPAKNLVFSSDGRVLAAVEDQNGEKKPDRVYLWSMPSGKRIGILEGHESRITTIAFSPDGKTLATGGYDKTLRLWEVSTARERDRWEAPDGVTALAFSADGRMLAWVPGWSASADRFAIRLAVVADGKEVRRLPGHQAAVTSLAFTRDGMSLISASADTTLLVWDAAGIAIDKPVNEVSREQLDALWAELAGADAGQSYRAMLRLGQSPAAAVSALSNRVKPIAAVDAKLLERLIADLDSKEFAVREKASAELEKFGELAEPALKTALAAKPSLETSRRLEDLLDKALSPKLSADQLRTLRAVEVLEHIGTPEARQALQALARGAPGARPTQEAQAALERLTNRPAAAR